MAKRSKNKPAAEQMWLWGAILVLVVIVAYLLAWWTGFIWDDQSVVTQNPVVVGPLGLKEIWTTAAADICPLTISTFWLEHKLWGLAPLPYHLVNVALHAACGVLLWGILRRLRVPGAWLGAALWAVHPVMVESVVWISELKNTESALFFLLSTRFFIDDLIDHRDGKRGAKNYGLTLLFAALAMAAKSSTVILPLVLGLCAWWIEGRWNWRNAIRLIPMLLMAIAAGCVTLWTQSLRGTGEAELARSWPERIATAGDAIWFYLGKLAWPYPLMPVYPRWHIDSTQVVSYLPLIAALAALLIFWLKRKSWGRPWFFAFVFFVMALLPVLGLTNTAFSRFSLVADHFQYLAAMGPLALVGAGLAALANRVLNLKPMMQSIAVGFLLAVLCTASWSQEEIFQSEKQLWSHTLRYNPNCWLAYTNLGIILDDEGKRDEAIAYHRKALEFEPNFADIHNNLGAALSKNGDRSGAIEQYEEAVKLRPGYSQARNNLGALLARTGKIDEAIAQFRAALKIDPHYAEVHYNLALALFGQGQKEEAVAQLQDALKDNPGYAEAHSSLGLALAQMGRPTEAVPELEEALRLNPSDAAARQKLAELKGGQK